MSTYNTTGGGVSQLLDRKITKKVVVSTDGDPADPGGPGTLTSVNITEEAGGIRRGVFEYTVANAEGTSYGGFNPFGVRVELTGSTTEAPIETHPTLDAMTQDDLEATLRAVAAKDFELVYKYASGLEREIDSYEQCLFLFEAHLRKQEYFLAPNGVVGRISEIESTIPSLDPLGKVANPSELAAPNRTFWICTGISARPIENKYEVTREYTLNFSSWENVSQIYGWA